MSEEESTGQVALREAVVQLIGLAAMAATVLMMDQRAQITLKAWWGRVQVWASSWNEAADAGEVAAAWFLRENERKIVAEAERLTMEGDDGD